MAVSTQPAKLKYTQPDEEILTHVLLPFALSSYITWIPKLHGSRRKIIKYPSQSTNDPTAHMDLTTALSHKMPIGLVCNELHTLIAFDSDGVPAAHPRIANMLGSHPTYVEATPSGVEDRYRIIYSLPNLDTKTLFKRKASINIEGAVLEFYNYSKNYITLTGKSFDDPPIPVATISAEALTSLWPELVRADNASGSNHEDEHVNLAIPATVADVSLWLRHVPCSRNDSRVSAFTSKHGFSYHDFWLTGIMALHATFGEAVGLAHAINWSRNSEDFNEAELVTRWKSLSAPQGAHGPETTRGGKSSTIGPATYQWYYDSFIMVWPYTQPKSNKPVHTEYSNFQAFMKFVGLRVQVDAITHTVFLQGSSHELKRYYRHYNESSPSPYTDPKSKIQTSYDSDRLAAVMLEHTREFNFLPNHETLEGFINIAALSLDPTDRVSRFKQAVDAVPYDPATDTDFIDLIATQVLQRDPQMEHPRQDFQHTLVRKWLLSLGRTLWPELLRNPNHAKASAEGMLVLSGKRQGIGKSSFGVRLFPEEWHHLYVSPASPRFSSKLGQDRDYKLVTSPRLLVDYDEVERVLKLNDEADIKAELTATHDYYRAPYDRSSKNHARLYATMASTNRTDLVIPAEGARRFWWLNVVGVDTRLLDRLDRYKLWAQIKYELSLHSPGQAPWLLTTAEREYLMSYLLSHRSQSGNTLNLMDIYDFSPAGVADLLQRCAQYNDSSDASTAFFDLTQSAFDISRQAGLPNTAALRHSIIEVLSEHLPPEIYLKRTLFRTGVTNRNRQNRYLMPRLRELARLSELALADF